ncbi:MAG: hypothetical protein GX799_09955 [Crenarchaeota archaeon]|nr:hypothetical protein [Thermoproteota archaeon]
MAQTTQPTTAQTNPPQENTQDTALTLIRAITLIIVGAVSAVSFKLWSVKIGHHNLLIS